jgi:uncharacterized protein YbcC (UPF0753/DUF2309 family)
MKMKFSEEEKSIKPGNEWLALFSRLSGLGIAGFTSHELAESEVTTTNKEEKLPVVNKKSRVVKFSQNLQHCQQHFNCQPGKYHSCHASVDLWFYLSSQS